MESLISRLHQAVFNLVIHENGGRRRMLPNVIIMSRQTFLDLKKSVGPDVIALDYAKSHTETDRLFGVRVAYDNSMPLGTFQVAEAVTV